MKASDWISVKDKQISKIFRDGTSLLSKLLKFENRDVRNEL